MGYSIKQVYSNSKSSAICLGLELIDMYFASALVLGTVQYSVYRTAALRITYLQRVLREHNVFFSSRFYADLILSTRSDRD